MWIVVGALLLAAPGMAEVAVCPDGRTWAGNDLEQCPCCAQCPGGTWVKTAGTCKERIAVGPPRADGCRHFAQLRPASGIENPILESAHDIRWNDRIDVREKPRSAGKRAVVGQLVAGSIAEVLGEEGAELRVRSPHDGSVGWIEKSWVERLVLKNPKTGELCGP